MVEKVKCEKLTSKYKTDILLKNIATIRQNIVDKYDII